jgi:hypothetical protein
MNSKPPTIKSKQIEYDSNYPKGKTLSTKMLLKRRGNQGVKIPEKVCLEDFIADMNRGESARRRKEFDEKMQKFLAKEEEVKEPFRTKVNPTITSPLHCSP